MREVFQQDLAEVQAGLVDVSQLVLDAMRNATRAMETSDVSIADEVIGGDVRVDEEAARIDDLTIEILLLQAPVARDLRFIISTMRIGASLERMGDLASHVAQLARLRFPDFVGPEDLRASFVRAGELCIAQAEKVNRLLATEDETLIDDIIGSDDEIDNLHKEVLDSLTAHSEQGDARAAQIVDATLANRYFERFSDHCVSIARRMRYLQSGVAPETPNA